VPWSHRHGYKDGCDKFCASRSVSDLPVEESVTQCDKNNDRAMSKMLGSSEGVANPDMDIKEF
jgi:hypothetical protein